MSYRVLLTSTVKPDQKAALLPFLEANLPNVRSFNGCLNVTVLYDDETRQMVFDELWTTKEAHQAYLAFIDENGVLAELAAFLEGPPEIGYYLQLDI
ncbi:MAG: antibiotic biosynthesis monooxygenase [Marinobacter sp.]|uniref:putative quinol monooxygenase n=1 Tax=Marinobacter sp. TaxID=50741 RepID=UPI00299E76B6|nr:antibiotic biosynthesis monooxygenase [Marinobacter sp.]MDX1755384.1 antibiotic biosynthesis monooxygenase [Marinobacter sp.]